MDQHYISYIFLVLSVFLIIVFNGYWDKHFSPFWQDVSYGWGKVWVVMSVLYILLFGAQL